VYGLLPPVIQANTYPGSATKSSASQCCEIKMENRSKAQANSILARETNI
jgi:hypothetical protein